MGRVAFKNKLKYISAGVWFFVKLKSLINTKIDTAPLINDYVFILKYGMQKIEKQIKSETTIVLNLFLDVLK